MPSALIFVLKIIMAVFLFTLVAMQIWEEMAVFMPGLAAAANDLLDGDNQGGAEAVAVLQQVAADLNIGGSDWPGLPSVVPSNVTSLA